jgi:SHS2 domain-containing protein
LYRWVEHTGELELEIDAPSEAATFEQGFEAMRELLAEGSEGRVRGKDESKAWTPPRTVNLGGPDRSVLLADWLGEIAYLAECERLVPDRLASLELTDDGLEAVIEGRRGSPAHLVKAATYHRLSLERAGERWRATVVLDV